MHRPEMPLMMIERLRSAASSQPQRRARPVTVPRSWPTVERWWPIDAGLVDRQLGRERPAADARRVGLGDAEDVVQQVGPDAGARRGVAGDAVARGDVRIGAVVDVEQRSLRALEQHVLAGPVRVVERVADVADHRPERLAGAHRGVEDRLERERLGVEPAFEREVVQREQLAQLGSEALGMLQVLDAQRAARDLVLVRRADALAGGADLARAARLAQQLARLVDLDVERQDQRARFAHQQARAHLEPHRLETRDLAEQMRGIDDDAVADAARHARRA